MSKSEILTVLPKTNYEEPAPDVNKDAFFKVLKSRRSVRNFDQTPIPSDIMNECLDAAMLAPNSSNLQSWEFHWVRNPDKKAQLVHACLSQPTAKTAAELVVFIARTATWPEMRKRMLADFDKRDNVPKSAKTYYEKLIPIVMTQGPFGVLGPLKKILFFCRGLVTPTPRNPTSLADLKLWATKSAALACENYMLAIRACGFDTCAMEGFDAVRIAKLLKLPGDASVVMVISAGKRGPGGIYAPQHRFERSLFVKEHN